jgi:hypothetical protein
MRSLDTVAQLEDLDAVTERRSKKTTTINTERMTIRRFFYAPCINTKTCYTTHYSTNPCSAPTTC